MRDYLLSIEYRFKVFSEQTTNINEVGIFLHYPLYTVMIDEIDHYNDNLHPSVQFCPQSIPELCC